MAKVSKAQESINTLLDINSKAAEANMDTLFAEDKEAKVEEAVKDIVPQPVALTSDRFVLELREDGYYNVRSRDTNQLLIVGVSEEDVLAQYV